MQAWHFAVAMIAASPFGASRPVSDEPPQPSGSLIPFMFLDGDMERVVERGPSRGSDDVPVPGLFRDPATGRTAPVLVGASVILRGPQGAPDDEALAELGVERVRAVHQRLGMVLVRSARREDALELAARLRPEVERGALREAYPDLAFAQRAFTDIPPNDPRFPSQWYLEEIGVEDAWALSQGSPEVRVLVADNGCDLSHPDLVDKMDPGFDPFDDDGEPVYESGLGNEHGTACAGIVAASTDNGRDIAGTCPLCRLSCARLLPAPGELATVASDVLTFNFALESGAHVVSNSWGFVEAIPVPTPLRDAIVEAQQRGRDGLGAVVVFASGNDSRTIDDDELLAVPGVLGVGAVTNLGELTQFSNIGRSLDVVAPTGTITTDISGAGGATPGDVTTTFGGTSSACPVVAGVAALVLSEHPELSADEVNEAITGTARQSMFATPDAEGHDLAYGYGMVQPALALASLAPPAPPLVEEPAPEEPAGCAAAGSAGGALADMSLALLAVAWVRARVSLRRRARRCGAA